MDDKLKDPYEAHAPKEEAVEETKEKDPIDKAMDEAFNEPEATTTEVSLCDVLKEIQETRENTKSVLDAVKELVKSTAEIAKNVGLWRKAGKF